MVISKLSPQGIVIWFLALVTVVVFVNPYGVATGSADIDPYSPIRSKVSEEKNGKVLLLSSFDDFYSIQSNDDLRRETSEAFAERGYSEILSAASLGDSFFNIYLQSKEISHVLVPLTTSQRGEIRYKWGELGSIRIQLSDPYFEPVVGTAGDYPVVLYKVLGDSFADSPNSDNPEYFIKWGSEIRGEFYQLIRSKVEKGMYSYEYSKTYENGLDVNWVFSYPRSTDGLPDIPEIAEFQYQSSSPYMANVNVKVTLLAAYGPFAPPQIVRVIHNGESSAFRLNANQPAVVELKLQNGDKVRFSSVLPCQQPQNFQPGEEDWRKYCFGISDVQVRLGS